MSEQVTETPKKRRKAATGPRQSKPMFAIVTYHDEDGNAIS